MTGSQASAPLGDKYEIHAGTHFLTGTQVLVKLPLHQHGIDTGYEFVAGRPGAVPLTYSDNSARRRPPASPKRCSGWDP